MTDFPPPFETVHIRRRAAQPWGICFGHRCAGVWFSEGGHLIPDEDVAGWEYLPPIVKRHSKEKPHDRL